VQGAILRLTMPTEKSNSRSYRFTNSTAKKLERLAAITEKSDTAIIEDAIAHLLGTLERDNPIYLTSPKDVQKGHKSPRDAA
jgi:predicted DNA-binding protein